MSLFIRDFEALRSAKRAERLKRMSVFLTTFEETHWQLRSERSADFNIFSLLKVQRDEVTHSRFLAWLLDAEAGHGQGSRFLEILLELCGLDIPSEALRRYHVRTEFSGSESTIDIAVYRRGEFLIYLENKVFAPEGFNQIDREFRDMRRRGLALRIPEERQFAVFLTPTGRRPRSGDATHWHAISYDQIAAGFSKLLTSIKSVKSRTILSDWIDTISPLEVLMSVFSDESLLLLNNWDTVQDILAAERRLRKEFPELLFSLEPELAKNDWWQDGWVFVRDCDTQVYISNRHWLLDDTFLIWIGVDQFAPENLSGIKTSPELYVWVSDERGERHDLAQQLAEWITSSKHKVLGEIDGRQDDYVVRRSVLLPEEAEESEVIVRGQILDFFCHYAKVIWSFDALIRDYIGTD